MLLSDMFNEYTRTLVGSLEKLIPPTPFIGVSLQVQFHPWFKFYFLCFKRIVIHVHYHTQKQNKIKFKPRMQYY